MSTYPAQERFNIGAPSPYGASVAGVVPLVLDSSGNPQPISSTNPLPVTGGGGGSGGVISDLPFVDSTGQQFFYQDTGSGLTSYKLQDGSYVAYTPTAPIYEAASVGQATVTAQNSQTSLLAQIEANTAAGGSSGNSAAGATGSAPPANADYVGFNNGGTLAGVSAALGLPVNLIAQSSTYSPNNSTNGNSSAYSLANTSVWRGTLENVINQPYLTIGVISTQTVTLSVTQYLDSGGTIIEVPPIVYTVTGGVSFSAQVELLGNYFQAVVVNASGSTTTLYVDSYYTSILPLPQALTQLGNLKVAVGEDIPQAAITDWYTTPGYVYFLKAPAGTSTSTASWSVSRLNVATGQLQWAAAGAYTQAGTGYSGFTYA